MPQRYPSGTDIGKFHKRELKPDDQALTSGNADSTLSDMGHSKELRLKEVGRRDPDHSALPTQRTRQTNRGIRLPCVTATGYPERSNSAREDDLAQLRRRRQQVVPRQDPHGVAE